MLTCAAAGVVHAALLRLAVASVSPGRVFSRAQRDLGARAAMTNGRDGTVRAIDETTGMVSGRSYRHFAFWFQRLCELSGETVWLRIRLRQWTTPSGHLSVLAFVPVFVLGDWSSFSAAMVIHVDCLAGGTDARWITNRETLCRVGDVLAEGTSAA